MVGWEGGLPMTNNLYIEKGTGPAIVFSHGTLMDCTMFEPQIEYLSDTYRVIAYNSRVLTGHNVPHTLDDLADDCRDLLDQLEIERCVLAGMSVGGSMAVSFALRYQDRLNGLILIDAAVGDYTPEEQAEFSRKFSEMDIDGMVTQEFAEWAAPYCFGKTTYERNRGLVDHWIDRWCTMIPARAVYHQGGSWIAKTDMRPRLADIKVPTLIVHGEEDVPIPIEKAQPLINTLPDGALARTPQAGHSANLENPEAVNAAISAFLKRIHPN
jgi:3-oxoadipate enol-lactonase